LLAAAGHPNAAIAELLGPVRETVRSAAPLVRQTRCGVAGRLPPVGPATGFTAVRIGEVKALACLPLDATGAALSRRSCTDGLQVITDGICASVSAFTVRRG
jgi:hypothetical protein